MTDRLDPVHRRLAAIRAAGRERRVVTATPTGPTTARIDGRDVIVACSNDYLGLAWDPVVRAAATGGGATGSRLISGARPVHRAVEEALEDWLGRPALLFGSGYLANLAVFSTVCEQGDVVASDAANHASIIDGLRLSPATRRVVPHADPSAIPADARLIAVEGLYSMDGDLAPLAAYPRGPWLAVDEAHAIGCLGPGGRGVAAAAGVVPDLTIGTFGKAFGGSGAFVCGSRAWIELLVNAGRSFVFTTAPPEPVAAMALAALRRATDELRQRLAANVVRFRRSLRELGWTPLGDAHIVPIVTGPSAMALAARLRDRGVFAPGIRWPTVPAGRERIRFTVSAVHTDDQLDAICDALGPRSDPR
ncbi:MAG: aminotransferase class I/II-fold pyridoxal phosphate-dependent enzyme [Myxococcota bacterium]